MKEAEQVDHAYTGRKDPVLQVCSFPDLSRIMIHHQGPGVVNMASAPQGRHLSICWVPADVLLQEQCWGCSWPHDPGSVLLSHQTLVVSEV